MLKPDWIAVDWGTSNMRAWAMSASGTVLDEVRSDRGMGSLKPAEFEQALRDAIAPWDHKGAPMIACGMVGAKQGWMEAPYAAVPCAATPEGFTKPDAGDLDVHIIAGLKQADPADVMRGEETQIAGFLVDEQKLGRRHLPARNPHQMGPYQRRRGGKFPDLHDGRPVCRDLWKHCSQAFRQ